MRIALFIKALSAAPQKTMKDTVVTNNMLIVVKKQDHKNIEIAFSFYCKCLRNNNLHIIPLPMIKMTEVPIKSCRSSNNMRYYSLSLLYDNKQISKGNIATLLKWQTPDTLNSTYKRDVDIWLPIGGL